MGTVDSGYTLRSNRTRSDSATTVDTNPTTRPSINLNRHTPRRSRAHQLSLLGLDTDGNRIFQQGEGASEDVLLTGLSNRSTFSPTSFNLSSKVASKFQKQKDEFQFDIGPSSDDDDNDTNNKQNVNEVEENGLSGPSDHGRRMNSTSTSHRSNGKHVESSHFADADRQIDNSSTYDDLDLEAAQEYNHFDDEDEGEYGFPGEREIKLPFESTTKRERIWMWASTGVVIALSMVSIAIAVDWIDWPGDGIGNN